MLLISVEGRANTEQLVLQVIIHISSTLSTKSYVEFIRYNVSVYKTNYDAIRLHVLYLYIGKWAITKYVRYNPEYEKSCGEHTVFK